MELVIVTVPAGGGRGGDQSDLLDTDPNGLCWRGLCGSERSEIHLDRKGDWC
jgi:hypothetical protein